MVSQSILLFGYGSHGRFIASGLHEDGFKIKIVESNPDYYEQAREDGYIDVEYADVTSDSILQALNPQHFDQLVCVMEDEHLNVFLTLSLRSLFKECYILSISDSMHTTKKLKMAGADKVIDLYEVSANKIYNILRRPVATKILEGIVMERDGVVFREIPVPERSFLEDVMTDDLDLAPYGILLIGMIDEELGHTFVFITAGINHRVDAGDTLVCIGPKDKLDEFEAVLKKEKEL
ncbi:potassium channel protein [Sulfurovum lithotrophicum]|uniref:Potassium channel protein n=1 Tax=Sulfurovum lithotrophicum TaxID=206403 RepID=A0A7U4M1N6_9BACT|nr:NAD(P)-binding protein [Sulfurovum lithotrophicum]AKF25210.1 potassium channel protein [Sulfurovum lithotrophicum]